MKPLGLYANVFAHQLLYLPQYILMLLTATSFGLSNPNAVPIAFSLQALSWTMQFLGHGLAERRAPALLNNLVGGTYSLFPPLERTALLHLLLTDHMLFMMSFMQETL